MLGRKGPFESFKQAKHRAVLAAEQLIVTAQAQEQVVLFAHGYINHYICKALIKRGWLLNTKDNNYWGVTSLTKL